MANVILVITGGVRAPRGLEIAAGLSKRGHRVRILITRVALLFLGPHFLTRPLVFLRFLRLWKSSLGEALGYLRRSATHVGSAKWADTVLVAPCTANTMGKIAMGLSNSYPLLVIRALARGRTVLIAPSMNPEMWEDPVTQRNYIWLADTQKYRFIGPVEGVSTSGDQGKVMASADEVVDATCAHLVKREALVAAIPE
jgi:phosphopantothenoylcysteine decarboxylase / phosphopantothenate---cysteine ligase